MKLISCHIRAFGKIKNFDYEFAPDFNVIEHENGWGKTTFSMFIKSMFYGLKITNSPKLDVNERKKYKPWNTTETFGGSITYEDNGKKYKIERNFGLTSAQDEVTFTDLETGKSSNDADKINEFVKTKLLCIDEDGFMGSLFFPQKGLDTDSASLKVKYDTSVEEDSAKNYERAVKILDEKASKIKYKRGDKGKLPDVLQEISLLEEEIQRIKIEEPILTSNEIKIKQIENEIFTLEKEIENLNAELKKVHEYETYIAGVSGINRLKGEVASLKEKKDNLLRSFNGKQPSITEVSDLTDYYEKYRKTESDIISKQSYISGLEEIKIKTKSTNFKALFLIPLCLILVSIGLYFINVAFGGFVTFAGVLTLIFVPIFKPKDKKTEDASLLKKRAELESAILEKQALFDEISSVLSSYGIKAEEQILGNQIEKIKDYGKEYLSTEQSLNSAVNQLNAYGETQITNERNKPNLSMEEIQGEINLKSKQKENLINDRYILNGKINLIKDKLSELPEKEGKLELLKQERVKLEQEYDILIKTRELLDKANDNLKKKVKEPLENSINEYMNTVSDKKYKISIDLDLNVSVEEDGALVKSDYYSTGLINLFNICKRFALIDVLFKDKRPFVMLDDPFYNLDDVKLNNSLQFIKNISSKYQILYFICHSSRK